MEPIVVSVYHSLMRYDVENLFICLCAICVWVFFFLCFLFCFFFLMKYLYTFFAHFLIGLFFIVEFNDFFVHVLY